MKKRRILSALLTGVMVGVLVLSGCSSNGGSDKKEESKSENEGGEKKYKIGFANSSVSNSWRVTMRDMLMEEADNLGVEIIETDAGDDADTLNSNIETMLQEDLDAILITPVDASQNNPGIETAYDAGIPVIIFDRLCTTDKYTHFIGWPDSVNGAACAQMVVDALTEKNGEPKGNIVALDSMAGSGTDVGQKEGQDSVFSKYPDIKIIDRQYTDFDETKGKEIMADWLTAYGKGEIDMVISQDGGVTLGAYDAIKEAGREDDGILFVNADGINGVLEMVKDGTAYGLTEFPCQVSKLALQLAIDCIEGKDPADKDVIQEAVVVTKDNVDEYYDPDGDTFDWTY